jgi:hypothetical protein
MTPADHIDNILKTIAVKQTIGNYQDAAHEDYLQAIYDAHEAKVQVNLIASALQVTRARVYQLINEYRERIS